MTLSTDTKHTTESHALIELPIAQVWEKLQDFGQAHKYVPGVIKVEIKTVEKNGVGASRRVFQKHLALDESIVSWHEGEGFSIRLHNGEKAAFPFQQAFFDYELEAKSDTQTKITTRMRYSLAFGGFGVRLNQWLFAKVLAKNVRDVGTAMKLFYESGSPTTPEILAAYKQTQRAQ